MTRNDNTTAIIHSLLRFSVSTAAIASAFVIPNALIALEKPLNKYFDHLDKETREREGRRIIRYMKSQGLLAGEYEHGMKITKKGQKRLKKLDFKNIKVVNPKVWDHLWRLVFYDIPEEYKSSRDVLTAKLRELGFFQLQRSIWIHPFPCREVIEQLTENYNVEKYVSYIETAHLDNQSVLIKQFQKRLPTVSFK